MPAEQALRESEQNANRLNAVLVGIARIFREALTCATEEELGKVCLSVAEEITQSKFGYIDEINRQTGKLDAIALSDPGWHVCRMHDKSGHGQKVLSGFSISGLHGLVLQQGASLITNAPSLHPGRAGTPEGHPLLTAFLGVPLKHAGQTIGLIGLGNREGGYGQHELAAVEALAPAIVQAFISKRAEEQLRRKHEEYRHLVENSGSVILRVDTDMRITFVNQYGLRFFGYRPEEIIGQRALGTIVPLREDSGRDTAAMAEDILRSPNGYLVNVHQNLRKDGSLVWMSWTNTPIYDGAGRLIEILSIGNDLSELKQVEAALRQASGQLQESETRYRTLVELAPDAVLVHQERKIVFANAEALRLYGANKPDELLGRDIVELVAPADRGTAAERVEHAQGGHRTPTREFPLLTLDGRCVPAEARGSGIQFRGRPAVQVIIRDITERKRAELALRQSEEKLRTVAESMPQLVWEVLADGSPGYFNRRWSEYTGEEPGGIEQRAQLVHPDDRERMLETWRAASRAQTLYECKYRIRRRDGQYRWNLSRALPLRSADGEVLRWFGTITDIHDLEATQETLREQTAALQSLNEKLKEADCRKNEFLATLSHELRNPLAPISNSLYVLDQVVPGGDQAKRAKAVIDRQFRHLSHLVDDLLDITRISRNKIHLRRERADLCDIVRRSAEDQRSLFDGGKLSLEVDLPAESIFVHVDVTRMAQVVGNLLQNAAKFTRGGGLARVSVSTDVSRGQAVVRVRDTGAGMTAETISGLFQPFVQADHTLDRSEGGLGLGLALVKGLVELHGGEVSAHSDGLGHGAELVVRLPLGCSAETQAERIHIASPRRKRILLIEDNCDAADSLREALELSGHEVLVAHNGPDGISKARDCLPDFVLCDIGLPGMNGYDVARTLREDEALMNARLIALSGYALPEDLQRSAEAGFEQHIAKPPSLATLATILGTPGGEIKS